MVYPSGTDRIELNEAGPTSAVPSVGHDGRLDASSRHSRIGKLTLRTRLRNLRMHVRKLRTLARKDNLYVRKDNTYIRKDNSVVRSPRTCRLSLRTAMLSCRTGVSAGTEDQLLLRDLCVFALRTLR